MDKQHMNGRVNKDGSITSAFVQRNFTAVKAMAAQSPVQVTVHGRKELVILSKEEFDRMNQAGLAAGHESV